MSRRKQIDDQTRLAMLLGAVSAHPWARSALLRSHSGLRQSEFEEAVKMARRYRLIKLATIPGLGQPPARYGLTAAGAARISAVHSSPWQQRALLAALKLDHVRSLLTAWHSQPGVVWALSPFLLPAQALRPPRAHENSRREFAALAYRSLHLDALACLRLAEGKYLNVALLTDPGNLRAEWMQQQFRSAHAWRRRAEFRRDGNTYFPVIVVITTDMHRLTQAVQLWREAMHDGDWLSFLRLTTLDGLAAGRWWNERCRPTSLWGGTVDSSRPSRRSAAAFVGWWGEAAGDEVAANQPQLLARRPSAPQITGIRKEELRRLLDLHQATSPKARELLDRIGQYPLITAADLALVMAYSDRHVRAGLQELKSAGLAEAVPGENCLVLTWLGLCLLSAQVGLPPVEYARLRGWPLRRSEEGTQYAVGWFDSVRPHSNLVMDFLVGLCRHGQSRLQLVRWDHVQCLFDLPARTLPGPDAGQERLRAVVPDAVGVVALRTSSDTTRELAFWLEVDRASTHGQALADKLARYFRIGGSWDGLGGSLPRLLILVERGGEGRLQTLRRRLRGLNAQYRSRLDVRLARADMLADAHGRLNPLQPSWRTEESSEFVSAFEG